MKPTLDALRPALVATLVLVSTLAAGVALTDTSAASLSGATARDVVVGQANVSQAVTVRGQATRSGGTTYYVVDVTEVQRRGAVVRGVRFQNVGADGDRLGPNASMTFDRDRGRLTLGVREDPADRDRKLDFQVHLRLDTTAASSTDPLRYEVAQYADAGMTDRRGAQAAQFRLRGSTILRVRTADEEAGAYPTAHQARLTMPTRARGVTHLVVETPGANYRNLSHADVVVRRNGSADLLTAAGSVDGAGSVLVLELDSATNFSRTDAVTVRVERARNPSNSSLLTLSFRRGSRRVFVTSGELEVSVTCEGGGAQRAGPTSTDSPGFGPTVGAGAVLVVAGMALSRRLSD